MGVSGGSKRAGTWNTSLPVGTLSALSPSAEFWAAAVTPSHRQNMIPLMGLHKTANSQWLLKQHHTEVSFAMQSDCALAHRGHTFEDLFHGPEEASHKERLLR